jgi:hypothetical protein
MHASSAVRHRGTGTAWAPTKADLDAATARTAAAIAGGCLADAERAAALEEAVFTAYAASGPEARAELEAGI